MTVIAAIVQDGEVYIAGDRGASEGDIILALDKPKVWRNGEYVFGYFGSLHGEVVKINFIPPRPTGNIDKFMQTTFRKALREFYNEWDIPVSDSNDFGLLIGVQGKIYEHNIGDMSITSYELPYLSLGSGSSYAIGSLYATQNYKDPKRRLKIAMECAVESSTTCREPIDYIG
jgi:ATP-dependent protease HslVU (ClpYQ) peptidase subunit